MATYKLIQDIEAEDHILGPLTLRQFIFALIAIFLFYICYVLVVKHIYVILPFFILPALFFGFFALPLGRDQPTEVWALAKLRYWFKPRRRVWNQSGVKELVTITVPKKIERVFTDGLSQTEVKSRLQALATTIDTRGWAVKNVDIGTYGAQTRQQAAVSSDRLVDIASLPQVVPDNDVMASDDILDEQNNPIAQQFSTIIDQSSMDHRQQLMEQLSDVRQQQQVAAPPADPNAPLPGDKWFMSGGQAAAAAEPAAVVAPQATAASSAVTPPSDPAIISLASNDDLNVATLAREAKKAKGEDDEVVISLH